MPALLDEPPPRTRPPRAAPPGDPAHRLQTTMAATKVSFTWFGVRKALSAAQKEQAADSFAAEAQFLSAAKKLLDTRHDAYRAVTAVRGRVLTYWRGITLPYPEPGLRLIRQDDLAPFDAQLQVCRDELAAAVEALDAQYAELREAARIRLGALYDPRDYPASLTGAFGMMWEFPTVEPPEYLRRLNPALYEQECRRVRERFETAVTLAEQAFVEELAQLVAHLTDRLAGRADGTPKVFRDSAIDKLIEFFDRFQRLNIRSNAELDALVDQTRRIVQGVTPPPLRSDASLRHRVAGQLATVQATLDQWLVDRPRRTLLRTPRPESA